MLMVPRSSVAIQLSCWRLLRGSAAMASNTDRTIIDCENLFQEKIGLRDVFWRRQKYRRDAGKMYESAQSPRRKYSNEGSLIVPDTLLGPDLLLVPVHQLALVFSHPALDAAFQDYGLDFLLSNFVEVVLQPACASRSPPVGIACCYQRGLSRVVVHATCRNML
jgi:hypothetical protein